MSQLTSQQARAIAQAEQAVADAKVELQRATEKRDEVRDRSRDRLPLGEELDVGGIRIKRIKKRAGRRFSLVKYLQKHKLTKAMEPFVTEAEPYEVWTVTS